LPLPLLGAGAGIVGSKDMNDWQVILQAVALYATQWLCMTTWGRVITGSEHWWMEYILAGPVCRVDVTGDAGMGSEVRGSRTREIV
jgi:hypothetical protein